jgi:hypothetical protein
VGREITWKTKEDKVYMEKVLRDGVEEGENEEDENK